MSKIKQCKQIINQANEYCELIEKQLFIAKCVVEHDKRDGREKTIKKLEEIIENIKHINEQGIVGQIYDVISFLEDNEDW